MATDLDIELIQQNVLPALAVLSPQEKRILILRYGLFGQEYHTQQEIAEMIGIPQQKVSRRIGSALKKIRRRLRTHRVTFADFL